MMEIDKQPNPSASRRSDALAIAADNDTDGWAAKRKWRTAIDSGFMIVPDVLLRAQSVLELDTVDLAIILNLVMHWWKIDDLPYPRPSVIAKRIGTSTRTVERRIAALQERKLIHRLPSEKAAENLTVRRFNLAGLIKQLEALSQENLADRSSSHNRSSSQ